MTKLASLAVLWGLMAACDPTEVSQEVVSKAAKTAEETQQAEAEAERAKAAEAAARTQGERKRAQSFAICMAGCAGGPGVEPTDRETCRLNCRQLATDAELEPTQNEDRILAKFDTCGDACDAEPNRTDAATCRLNCTQSVAASETKAEGSVRGCSAACLEDLVSCGSKCPPGADAAATCSLHCETAVKRCLRHCESDPGS